MTAIDRDAVEEEKIAIRRRRAAQRRQQVTGVVAQLEIAVEDLAGQDPTDSRLKVALSLLQGENADEALEYLAAMLGPEGLERVMTRIGGQQPADAIISPSDRVRVVDTQGHPQEIVVMNSDRRRELEHEGYVLQPANDGTWVLVAPRRQASAPQQRAALPAGPAAGPTGTAVQQPTAGVGQPGRRRWLESRTPGRPRS